MSWHPLAMCRLPVTRPSLQNFLISKNMNGNQGKSIKTHVVTLIGNVQASTLHSSPNLQASPQIPYMIQTKMQKKRSVAEAEPINILLELSGPYHIHGIILPYLFCLFCLLWLRPMQDHSTWPKKKCRGCFGQYQIARHWGRSQIDSVVWRRKNEVEGEHQDTRNSPNILDKAPAKAS